MEIDQCGHRPEDADRLLAAADRTADPVAAARLVAEAFVAVSRTADPTVLPPIVRRLARLRTLPPRPEVEFLHHAVGCAVGARTGRRVAPRETDDALRLFASAGLHDDPLHVECAMIATLSALRPDQVRPRFAALVERWVSGEEATDPARRARFTTMLGMGDAWSGDLLRGRATLRRAQAYAVEAGRLDLQAEIVSWLAKCEALCGDLTQARRCLDEARLLAARSGSAWVGFHIAECAAALHLAAGDVEAWVGVVGRLVDSAVGSNSGLVFEHRWELATHHALGGDAEAAQAVLAAIADPPLDWPGAPALPAWRAWIADPADPAAMGWLEQALAGLNRPVERLSRARLAWLLGAQHARLGRRVDAIRLLELASSEYAATGAAGLLARVTVDLDAVTDVPVGTPWSVAQVPSTRRGRPADAGTQVRLTAMETRVAGAVADGLSNLEAARLLAVSAKTIEFHLGNIYRKLGVRNRTELARHLSR
ncbi:helix-turn-helix transcriptional regulator [Verrucosispora sp. NA02020]|uniref:helix-turn-helix transcriptional regulator n=1 Tax=Verrucosispora sp. NA02020 TaxID=2742132 RepID=UPI00159053DB|nr:helix-turn-helix transcriptional regulator [Verrucosispora sp. NA02020]QKW14255.1 helix-turn-helix transcriptional regulator [Verrucosispora sp. NA02020]